MDSDLDSFLKSITSKSRNKSSRDAPEKEVLGRSSRELNPYWKDGGSGLPSRDVNKEHTALTGDGGLSWWTKALQRCKQTSAEEGKTLEEVASERYGSLAFLQNKIEEAEQHVASVGGRSSSSSSSSSNKRRDHGRWKGVSFKKPQDVDYHVDGRRTEERNRCRRIEDEQDREASRPSENYKQKLSSSRSSEPVRHEDSVPTKQPEQIVVISAEERNKISAKILRAEMMGDADLVEKLKAMLETSSQSNSTDEMEVRGRERKRDFSRTGDVGESTKSSGLRRDDVPRSEGKSSHDVPRRSKKQKMQIESGEGDNMSLDHLVKQEKLGSGLRNAALFRKLGKTDRPLDEDETIDDRVEKCAGTASTFSKEKHLAAIEKKMMSSKIDGCAFCLKNLQKHLIVSMGTNVLLCLPRHKSMVAGHCLIVPVQHAVQSTAVDEDVMEEMNLFKKCLVRMFEKNDEDVVFMETCKNLKHYPHLVIECIPLPREVAEEAPMYFQKAISECGPEWSNNKKLVTIKGGIKRSIPKGFPYFHVGFGMDEGYGHVIEDEQSFASYFGREVVGGMLDLDPVLWRRPRFDEFDDQRKKVLEFSNAWKEFDLIGNNQE